MNGRTGGPADEPTGGHDDDRERTRRAPGEESR
jgi:hypothetical protein